MRKKSYLYILVLIVTFTFIPLLTAQGAKGLGSSPTQTPEPVFDNIKTSVQVALQNTGTEVLGNLLYQTQITNIVVSKDEQQAIAQLNFVNEDDQIPSNSEPGLAIIIKSNGDWQTILPSDDTWLEALESLPDTLISAKDKSAWKAMYAENLSAQSAGPFHGYLLPWENGRSLYLTRSITHNSPPDPSKSMHYAFDFAAPHDSSGKSPMFEVYAAKSGTVKFIHITQQNGNHSSPGNYIVLKDTTTSPTTYQLYLHLAKNSIPAKLHTIGTFVKQGDFLGWADNTGYSTGNHLHFQVHTNPNSYWGNSVDITFDDVDINSGRPRTPNEANKYPQYGSQGKWRYVSKNHTIVDNTPPHGDILTPSIGETITAPVWHIEGWATDNESGLKSAQIFARYEGAWHAIGPKFDSILFSYDWDVCSHNVPEGPIALALSIEDKKGNTAPSYPGLRHLVKHHSCTPLVPPPLCSPSSNQIAIFSKINYRGECKVLDIGNYPDNTNVDLTSINGIASVLVGANAMATFYSEFNYQGRSETLLTNDPNLDDNRINSHSTKSLRIQPDTIAISAPELALPPQNTTLTDNDSVVLSWNDTFGNAAFRTKLITPTGSYTTSWDYKTSLQLGSLVPGTYTWMSQGKNNSNISPWSSPEIFTITHEVPATSTIFTAPFTDTLENSTNDWETSGLWHIEDNSNHAHSANHFWWYGNSTTGSYETGTTNSGWLTSPPIRLSASSTPYFIHFWSWAETESTTAYWDQRLVQISVDNQPYTNVIQIMKTPQPGWFKYSINLDNYFSTNAEHILKVRFFFHTLDSRKNAYDGWRIDDFSVFSSTPPSCSDSNEPNNTPANATAIQYGNVIDGMICPSRDLDYFTFTGSKGDRVVMDVDAKSIGSNLDSILYLLDNDGKSIITYSNDEVYAIKQDPHLSITLPYNGRYYFLLNAWNYPEGLGNYRIKLIHDTTPPTLSFVKPVTNAYLRNGSNVIQVNASDTGSGVRFVKFLWHSGDWDSGTWNVIGTDNTPEDGWSVSFDTSPLSENEKIIIYAFAYDWAGNWAASSVWNLIADKTPPSTTLSISPNPPDSTALHLTWNGTDNISGINHFDIRYKTGSGAWQILSDNIPSSQFETWLVGDFNKTYSFQIRSEDNAGNIQPFNHSGVVSTTIPSPSQLCQSHDAWDINSVQNDNTMAAATRIYTDTQRQYHSLCNPARTDRLYDEDWMTISITKTQPLLFTAVPANPNTMVRIRLLNATGSELAVSSSVSWGQSSQVSYPSAQPGTYYLQLAHQNGKVTGDSVSYYLFSGKFIIYIPFTRK